MTDIELNLTPEQSLKVRSWYKLENFILCLFSEEIIGEHTYRNMSDALWEIKPFHIEIGD